MTTDTPTRALGPASSLPRSRPRGAGLGWVVLMVVVAVVLEGDSAVEIVRAINGATDGRKAAPGTIRGDFSLSNRENLVHGSDSPESAAREIAIWFPALHA